MKKKRIGVLFCNIFIYLIIFEIIIYILLEMLNLI